MNTEQEKQQQASKGEESRFDFLNIPFHGATEADRELEKEQPFHRQILLMLAAGECQAEVARKTGYSVMTVSRIKRQPWAQEYLSKALAEIGGRSIEQTMLEQGKRALQDLDDLHDRVKKAEEHEIERKLLQSKLDRAFGTSTHVVRHENVDPLSVSDADLAKIIKQGQTN